MKNGNDHIIPFDLISRYLSGEASNADSEALNQWLAEDPENTKTLEEYKQVWEKTGILEGKPSFNIDEEWEHFQSNVNPSNQENQFWNFLAGPKFFGSFYKMAAVVAIGLILGYSMYYFSGKYSTTSILAANANERIELPDGSVVVLNKGAEITYPSKFAKDNRMVNFTGEGFFEVEKDPSRPFIIRSNNLSIRVLGTSFNVKANPESPEIEIIVNTGRVAVYEGSDRKNEQNLLPGQKAVYYKTLNKILVSENTNQNFLAWTTGKMSFNGSPMSEVLEVLSSVYHKKFIIETEAIRNCRLTVSFENQDIQSVLKIIEATLDIQFTESGDTIKLSGQGC